MAPVAIDLERTSREVYSVPPSKITVCDPELSATNTHWSYFERLRKEGSVHYGDESDHDCYWSLKKFKDIQPLQTEPLVQRHAHRRLRRPRHA